MGKKRFTIPTWESGSNWEQRGKETAMNSAGQLGGKGEGGSRKTIPSGTQQQGT